MSQEDKEYAHSITEYSSQIETQVEKFLLGKVLTIIDASYTDATQRDAVKNLIKDKFHSQLDWMLSRNVANDRFGNWSVESSERQGV